MNAGPGPPPSHPPPPLPLLLSLLALQKMREHVLKVGGGVARTPEGARSSTIINTCAQVVTVSCFHRPGGRGSNPSAAALLGRVREQNHVVPT